MKWKKILLGCLTLTFVFGGVFLISEEVFAETPPASATTPATPSDGSIRMVQKKDAYGVPVKGDGAVNRTINGSNIVNYSDIKITNQRLYVTADNKVYEQKGNTDFVKPTNLTQAQFEELKRKDDQSADQSAGAGQAVGSAAQSAVDAVKNFFSPLEWIGKQFLDALLKFAALLAQNILLRLAALIAGLSGMLFDKVIEITILEMSTNMKVGDASGFINIGWTILRDVVNISFIFVLLYISIMTIVSGFSSGTSKKIVTVVVVALLINFSLLFTKIIIDVSNIIAVNFYDTISNYADTSGGGGDADGIAGAFIKFTGLVSIYKVDVSAYASKASPENLIIIAIGGSVMLFVLAIVFVLASILLVSRYLILIIVLISSAAAVGSWILPGLKSKIYDKWWSALIGQAFLAPVFLLFLYLTLLFMEMTIKSSVGAESGWFTLLQTPQSGSIQLLLNYILVIGSLIGSLIVAKSLSDMAGSNAGKVTKWIGAGAIGTTAFAGRHIGGRAGAALLKEGGFAQRMADKGGLSGRIGTSILKTGDKMSKGTWDARNTKSFSGVAKATGLDLGDKSKKSYDSRAKEIQKEHEETAKLIKSKGDDEANTQVESEVKLSKAEIDKLPKEEREKVENLIKTKDVAKALEPGVELEKVAVNNQKLVVELATKDFEQKKIAFEAAKGTANESTAQGDLNASITNLNNQKDKLTDSNKVLAEKEKELTEAQNKYKEQYDNRILEVKNAGKLSYADRVERPTPWKTVNRLTLNKEARREAAKKIRKEALKTKEAREREELLTKAVANITKASPTPTPPPSPSPAPKP